MHDRLEQTLAEGQHVTDEPHPLLVDFASKLRPGRALDVACGPGRHAIWLAQRGWHVTAVDSSSTAIDTDHRVCAEPRLLCEEGNVIAPVIYQRSRMAGTSQPQMEESHV